MTKSISIYITAASLEEANKIGLALVEEALAACVNVIPGVKSIYRWQGKIEKAEEVALIVKTHEDLFERLEKRVKELHSYSCPCIVAWPIVVGHRPYLDWLTNETMPKKS